MTNREVTLPANLNFLSDLTDGKTFPIDIYPETYSKFININVLYHPNFNKSILANNVLVALSTALATNYLVEYKNSLKFINLFSLNVVGAGQSKTPQLKIVMKPISDKSNKIQEINKIKKAAASQYAKSIKGVKDENENNNKLSEILKKYNINNLDLIESQIEWQNGTFERLGDYLAGNCNTNACRSILINPDEILSFIKSLNQYRKGNDEIVILTFYDNNTFLVEKVTEGRSQYASKTNVLIVGNIPTKSVQYLLTKERINEGLIFRFLYVYIKEYGMAEYNSFGGGVDKLFQKSVTDEYYKSINNYLSRWDVDDTSHITLTDEANILFDAFMNFHMFNEYLNLDFEIKKEMLDKYHKYALAIACILSVLFEKYLIDYDIMQKACRVIHFYMLNAEELFNDLNGNKFQTTLKCEKEVKLFENLPQIFNGDIFIKSYKENVGLTERSGYRLLKKWQDNKIIIATSYNNYFKPLSITPPQLTFKEKHND